MKAIFHRRETRLPSGLKVITIETPHLHSGLCAVHVRVGSRHESVERNGITHFLEHVLFRGSENFPDSLEVNGLIEDVGGSLNGMTQRDQCAFDTPFHPSGLKLAIQVLGDMVVRPLFQGVELEREIILEEMMDEVDCDGRDIDAGNLVMKLMFGSHPLGMKVAGTTDSVRSISREDLKAHHARFFNASSMVLTVAGPVDGQEVASLAESSFQGLPAGNLPREEAPVILPVGPLVNLVDLEESQTDIAISFPCPSDQSPEYPALSMIRALLDDTITSWLQREIVETRGLAYSVRSDMSLFSDSGTFDVEATCTPSKVVAVVEAALSLFSRLARTPVDGRELSRVLERRRLAIAFHSDDLSTLVNCQGGVALFHDPRSFEEELEALSRVTPAQIMDVSRRFFAPERLHLCAVGPRIGRSKKAIMEVIRRTLRQDV